MRHALALLGTLALASACGTSGGDDSPPAGDCAGGKCDDADGTTGALDDASSGDDSAESGSSGGGSGGLLGLCEEYFEVDRDAVLAACEDRADTAFDPNRSSFQADAMRWSCADTPGRESADRGQEYCEYFAIVDVPPLGASVHGLVDGQGGQTPPAVGFSDEALAYLEEDPQRTAGACVFTTWNSDVMPEAVDATTEIAGVPLSAEIFQMKFAVNSRDAADLLVDECVTCPRVTPDADDPNDPLHDDFTRGCFLNAELNETPDRKSDSILCAGAGRLGECGCDLAEDTGTTLAQHLAVAEGLGFPLGGWNGRQELPQGCRYETVDTYRHNLVVCDVTASEVLANAGELKTFCNERFADDVVVYVPVPGDAVACEGGKSCGPTPWMVER